MGQDKVSGGVNILYWHATAIANILWSHSEFGKKKVKVGNQVQFVNKITS